MFISQKIHGGLDSGIGVSPAGFCKNAFFIVKLKSGIAY